MYRDRTLRRKRKYLYMNENELDLLERWVCSKGGQMAVICRETLLERAERDLMFDKIRSSLVESAESVISELS